MTSTLLSSRRGAPPTSTTLSVALVDARAPPGNDVTLAWHTCYAVGGWQLEWPGGVVAVSVHNPDRCMADLRTIVAQGRKRIGFLIGAGAAAGLPSPSGNGPLIPAIDGLTTHVLNALQTDYGAVLTALRARLQSGNIETILSRVRSLAGVIGDGQIDGLGPSSSREELGELLAARPVGVSRRLPPLDRCLQEPQRLPCAWSADAIGRAAGEPQGVEPRLHRS